MPRVSLSRIVGLLLCLVFGGAAARADDLSDAFARPLPPARPQVWWHWMDGNISSAGITADLEAMKAAGVGGAHIFNVSFMIPPGPVKYLSPQWHQMVQHAIREADRVGIPLGMHNTAGWSSSGAPWIEPDQAMQLLTHTQQQVQGPSTSPVRLEQPPTRLGTYRDIAVLAYPTPKNPARVDRIAAKTAAERADGLLPESGPIAGDAVALSDVIDLTAHLGADGVLDWAAPPGSWTIIRLGHTPSDHTNVCAEDAGRGLECDKLSPRGIERIWQGMPAKVIAAAGPLAGKSLVSMTIDSYEVGSQNWTAEFPAEFSRLRGYDMTPWMPALTGQVIQDPQLTERFLLDFRRTIADLFAEHYYGRFAELCHENGLIAQIEPYGNGPFDDLQAGGQADISMGEFWIGGWISDSVKHAASIAHTNGRLLAGAEAFTAGEKDGRWQVGPAEMKALGDRAFCQGLNRTTIHRYCHQPWTDLRPGMTMGPWGVHFERTLTWWNQAIAWTDYLARCQQMLQSGRFVADALYLSGELAPQSAPSRQGLKPALPAGYDYDVCSPEVVLTRLSVRDGKLVMPDGMSYRVLVLPDVPFATPELLEKVRELVLAGATVVGPRPQRSPSLSGYPESDDRVRTLADELWGDCDGQTVLRNALGSGSVYWGEPMDRVLAGAGGPDVSFTDAVPTAQLNWIHRRTDDADIYFVASARSQPTRVLASFRVTGRRPELWDPMTGRTEPAAVYQDTGSATVVPLDLDPSGSVFVVFRDGGVSPRFVRQQFTPDPGQEDPLPAFRVLRAVYGAGQQTVDVTTRLEQLVRGGLTSVRADNELAGDPAPGVVKQFTVEWEVDGERKSQSVEEGREVEILPGFARRAYELSAGDDGGVRLTAFKTGTLRLDTPDGQTVSTAVQAVPPPIVLDGAWDVRFAPGLGAPERVTLDRLISWPKHPDPGVRYFSGTATYSKALELPGDRLGPGRRLFLDLGTVKNIAEVRLNGQDIATLWTPPFVVELTARAVAGPNALEVRVTNLWPNRLIGDEQLPDDREWAANGGDSQASHLRKWPDWLLAGEPRPSQRVTFTTWRFYTKDSPLLESGLIGPVTITSPAVVQVR